MKALIRRVGLGVKAIHEDTAGAMSVEKILILALISVPILIILVLFRNKIEGWFSDQSSAMQQDSSQDPTP